MLFNSTLFKYHKIPLVFMVLSLIFYGSFAYDLIRTDSLKLLLLYFGLFVFAYQLIKNTGFNFRLLVIASLLFRLAFLAAIPNLSQDFYRFIWDGRLLFEGYNPYLYTPDAFIENGQYPMEQAEELYKGMGELSSGHYTNYPPINQLCFFIAALLGGKSILSSIIVLRVIIIFADFGIIYFGKKLLEKLKLPSSRIWLYALNPFIIIELTGNLHFEGVMLFFLLWSIYLLYSGQWIWAAVLIAMSISTKLMPLIFLPLFFIWFIKHNNPSRVKTFEFTIRFKKALFFFSIVALTITLLFLPFFSAKFINNYSETVGLWFTNFEFNASIYYLVREIGYAIKGYNLIGVIGKILPVITLISILLISFLRKTIDLKDIISSMVLGFSVYLFLSTTVHPWYISTLVLLCVFSDYRYPIIWSAVIVLSYLAYSDPNNKENLWVVGLEYAIVFSAFIYEVFLKKRLPLFGQS